MTGLKGFIFYIIFVENNVENNVLHQKIEAEQRTGPQFPSF